MINNGKLLSDRVRLGTSFIGTTSVCFNSYVRISWIHWKRANLKCKLFYVFQLVSDTRKRLSRKVPYLTRELYKTSKVGVTPVLKLKLNSKKAILLPRSMTSYLKWLKYVHIGNVNPFSIGVHSWVNTCPANASPKPYFTTHV